MKFYIQIPSGNNWERAISNPDFDNLSKEELNKIGYYEYIPVNAPYLDYNYKTWYENKLQNGVVTMVWHKELKTGKELVEAQTNKWAQIRYDRNVLLANTDYTQLSDTPFTQEQRKEWAVYRQALRDITTQPDPFNIVFPTSPKGQNLNIEVHRVG